MKKKLPENMFIPNWKKDPSVLKKLADLWGYKKVKKGARK